MNIKEAKNEVMKAVKIYLEKDEHGEYRVPVVRQRPLFLQGAPGLGKMHIRQSMLIFMEILRLVIFLSRSKISTLLT